MDNIDKVVKQAREFGINEAIKQAREFGIREFSIFHQKEWVLILNNNSVFFITDKESFDRKYKESYNN